MGAGHAGALSSRYLAGTSPVHRLAPHVKLVAVLGFALVVVATPVHAPWAPAVYAGDLVLVLGVAALVLAVRGQRRNAECSGPEKTPPLKGTSPALRALPAQRPRAPREAPRQRARVGQPHHRCRASVPLRTTSVTVDGTPAA